MLAGIRVCNDDVDMGVLSLTGGQALNSTKCKLKWSAKVMHMYPDFRAGKYWLPCRFTDEKLA